MLGTVYTSIPCGPGRNPEPLEDGLYSSVNGIVTNLGTPTPGDYFISYKDKILRPTTNTSVPSDCTPPTRGVYVSDGSNLSRVDPGIYEVAAGSIRPHTKTCPPPPVVTAHPNGDLLLAALIGGFVGNSLEKNLSGSAEDIEEEEYQL